MSDMNEALQTWLDQRAAEISADPENPIAKEAALRAAFINAFTETTDEESK